MEPNEARAGEEVKSEPEHPEGTTGRRDGSRKSTIGQRDRGADGGELERSALVRQQTITRAEESISWQPSGRADLKFDRGHI